MIERGIVLCAFGKRGYVWAAHNLAFSIKYFNPDMNITLLHDGTFESELLDWQKTVFDKTIFIPDNVMYKYGKLDPANIKISIYDFLPYKYNLFIDVDAKALQDLNVIFDELIADGKHYYAHVIGEHNIKQGREIPSMYWAFADDIWRHYNLPDDAILPSTNSSFQFIEKCEQSEKLFAQIRANYDNPIPLAMLRHRWGNSQPDELYLNIALAQLNIMPRTPRSYLWMANEGLQNTLTWIQEQYPLLCLFGSSTMIRTMYSDWYDRMLINEMRSQGKQHYLKWHKIVRDKHANTKSSPVHESVYRDDIMVPNKMPGKVHLIVPFYTDRNAERNKELNRCIMNNIGCRNIDRITLIYDGHTEVPAVIDLLQKYPNKVFAINKESRQTFRDAVDVANTYAEDDTISIVVNSDIYLDERNVQLIKGVNLKSTALSLSRYNVKGNGTVEHFVYEWSQDTWVWSGHLDTSKMNLDFPFGKPFCDSRFSFELTQVRERVANPSYSIRTYHLHNVNTRNYTEAERLTGSGIDVRVETAHRYMKRRLLFIQPGKVGDIILCLPIVRAYSKEFIVDWKCPKQYHPLFNYVDYANPVENVIGAYDRTIDIAFGLGGAPEKLWQENKHKYDSFVNLKYELAGIDVAEKTNLIWNRNVKRENELYDKIFTPADGDMSKNYTLVHSKSDYGTPIKFDAGGNYVEFSPLEDYTIFDWYKVIINAKEIHCIDSSLCNFIDAIKEARDIPKFYHKTDKVPAKYDETILTNNWTRA